MTSRRHAFVLVLLLGLFAFRIAAQLVQAFKPTTALPPFDAWQSGALPYPALLASQFVITGLFCVLVAQLWQGRLQPRRRTGRVLLALGAAYFGAMALRLVAGLTVLSHVGWFAVRLPAIFHLVLASAVLTLAHFHLTTTAPSGSAPDVPRGS